MHNRITKTKYKIDTSFCRNDKTTVTSIFLKYTNQITQPYFFCKFIPCINMFDHSYPWVISNIFFLTLFNIVHIISHHHHTRLDTINHAYTKPCVTNEVFNMSETEPVAPFVAILTANLWDNIIP